MKTGTISSKTPQRNRHVSGDRWAQIIHYPSPKGDASGEYQLAYLWPYSLHHRA